MHREWRRLRNASTPCCCEHNVPPCCSLLCKRCKLLCWCICFCFVCASSALSAGGSSAWPTGGAAGRDRSTSSLWVVDEQCRGEGELSSMSTQQLKPPDVATQDPNRTDERTRRRGDKVWRRSADLSSLLACCNASQPLANLASKVSCCQNYARSRREATWQCCYWSETSSWAFG